MSHQSECEHCSVILHEDVQSFSGWITQLFNNAIIGTQTFSYSQQTVHSRTSCRASNSMTDCCSVLYTFHPSSQSNKLLSIDFPHNPNRNSVRNKIQFDRKPLQSFRAAMQKVSELCEWSCITEKEFSNTIHFVHHWKFGWFKVTIEPKRVDKNRYTVKQCFRFHLFSN